MNLCQTKTISIPIFALTLLLSSRISAMDTMASIGNTLVRQEESIEDFIAKAAQLSETQQAVYRELKSHYPVVSVKDIYRLDNSLCAFSESLEQVQATKAKPEVGESLSHPYAKGNALGGAKALLLNGERVRKGALTHLSNTMPASFLTYYIHRYECLDPKTITQEEQKAVVEHLVSLNQYYAQTILSKPQGTFEALKQEVGKRLMNLHTRFTRN